MTILYLVRHGQSVANLTNSFGGISDYELTDTGKLQAKLLSEYLKDIHTDCIYSSDLSRAYNTILPTAKIKGIAINKNKNLREINGGIWERQSFDDIANNYSNEFSVWKNDTEYAYCPGGESIDELRSRFFGEIEEIVKVNENKSILAATHAMAIRTFLSKVYKKPVTEIDWVSNASVSSFEYKNGSFFPINIGFDNFLKGVRTTLGDNI